jgi:hypothetical protein
MFGPLVRFKNVMKNLICCTLNDENDVLNILILFLISAYPEPKMEVSSKSSEESTSSALIAGGGFVVFAVAAGFILTHLPDPNQF